MSVAADATIGLGSCCECWDLCSLEGKRSLRGKAWSTPGEDFTL